MSLHLRPGVVSFLELTFRDGGMPVGTMVGHNMYLIGTCINNFVDSLICLSGLLIYPEVYERVSLDD